MRHNVWGCVVVVVFTLLLFVAIGGYDLRESDEPRAAGIASGMVIDRDWILPKLNGKPFLEEPPLVNPTRSSYHHNRNGEHSGAAGPLGPDAQVDSLARSPGSCRYAEFRKLAR